MESTLSVTSYNVLRDGKETTLGNRLLMWRTPTRATNSKHRNKLICWYVPHFRGYWKKKKKDLKKCTINPITASACNISGLRIAPTRAWKWYISWSYNNSTFSTVHLNKSPFTCSCESLNDFKFGTFIGHFPSDMLASMAVKGLKRKEGYSFM